MKHFNHELLLQDTYEWTLYNHQERPVYVEDDDGSSYSYFYYKEVGDVLIELEIHSYTDCCHKGWGWLVKKFKNGEEYFRMADGWSKPNGVDDNPEDTEYFIRPLIQKFKQHIS